MSTAIYHHLDAYSISEDTRCQAHVRLVAARRDWSKWISLVRAMGIPRRWNVRRWRMSRATGANVKLTHDASKGALVVAEGAMAYLARNSLGVADQEFAQVVEAGAGDDWNWCGNGRANDDWSGPATCGSWGDADWIDLILRRRQRPRQPRRPGPAPRGPKPLRWLRRWRYS